jgi:PEP-CTERM motif-containing protein
MRTRNSIFFGTIAAGVIGLASPALAAGFVFSTGDPDGKIATASGGSGEPESADDFVLASKTHLTSGSFTGLLVPSTAIPTVTNVSVEIYRVFPLDSASPPSGNVPTRVNSPSDVEFTSFDAADSSLSFATAVLASSFTVLNSVTVGGIHPIPGEFTGGNGPASGQEVLFNFTFNAPSTLDAGHYFFVPQVEVSGGDFLWLSAPRPITSGTPFAPDLQSWIRDEDLQPDWLRIGTDITHQGPFNAAFSLTGVGVPEPGSWAMMIVGLGTIGALMRRRSRPAQLA